MKINSKYDELVESWLDFASKELKVRRDSDFDDAIKHLAEEIYKCGCNDILEYVNRLRRGMVLN